MFKIKLCPLPARRCSLAAIFALGFVSADMTYAQVVSGNALSTGVFALYGQATHVTQWHPGFRSSYRGGNSLDADNDMQSTDDITAYAGARLWQGAEFWINPELDMGFGLSNTLGSAGYPSGEAYKVGRMHPYFRLPRAFVRQVIALGRATQTVDAGPNRFGDMQPVNNLILTLGKFSVTDIFDTNRYAHDPRGDFLNWSIVDAGAFDYAADAWGYTYGGAIEWTQSSWTVRGGMFALSKVPNSTKLASRFDQYALITEIEQRYKWAGHPGKIKLLGFDNRGHMGSYQGALALAVRTTSTPDTSLVRHSTWRPGVALNIEQELTSDLGLFLRLSTNAGDKEAFEFTEINRSLSTGLAFNGDRWGRHGDIVGISSVVNVLSLPARDYFAAGGMGILIGDGRLNYGNEQILETYYAWHATTHLTTTLDYQYIDNPAYNRDRGPVSIVGVRLHADF